MREIDLVYRTLYAELGQRLPDAPAAPDDPLGGRFLTARIKGRDYLYFQDPVAAGAGRRYVGPATDPDIVRRAEAHRIAKDDLRARRKLVSTLVRQAGLEPADRFAGDVAAALAESGLFRRRVVLVGPAAFRAYPAFLGIRVPPAALSAVDGDPSPPVPVAAPRASIPAILDVLAALDPAMRPGPSRIAGPGPVRLRDGSGREVALLATDEGDPATLPSGLLGYLVEDPVRAVMLHRSGIDVRLPSPERFAVHGLLRAGLPGPRGPGDAGRAALLMVALGRARRPSDLADAFSQAWERGAAWRDALRRGLARMPEATRDPALAVLVDGLRGLRADPAAFGL